MAKTLKERFITALAARGETKVKDTFKYVVMTKGTTGLYYYIGVSGSLRVGRTVATSVPCSMEFKYKLLADTELKVNNLI